VVSQIVESSNLLNGNIATATRDVPRRLEIVNLRADPYEKV
jgi:hypothetical protein